MKGECKMTFSIKETTQGSAKKTFNYEGKRVKLTTPIVIEVKDKKTKQVTKIVKNYHNVIKSIGSD